MNPRLQAAIDRCLTIFSDRGEPRSPEPLDNDFVFERVEQRTNIRFDEDLKDFFRQLGGNGADGQSLFAVEAAGPVLLGLRAPGAAIADWSDQKAYPLHEGDIPPRDTRIQRDVVSHPGWFPLAEFDDGTTTLYYDTAPTPQGQSGQIIAYLHDANEVLFVADDFVSFLERSNELLEKSGRGLVATGKSAGAGGGGSRPAMGG